MNCGQRYHIADDCPYCGEKDSEGAWKGARRGNSTWGHNYSCCSEECGVKFLNSPQHKALETKEILEDIQYLKRKLSKINGNASATEYKPFAPNTKKRGRWRDIKKGR